MNLTKFISTAILLLLSLFATGQKGADLASIKWGNNVEKEKFKHKEIEVLGEVGGAIYVLKLEYEYEASKLKIEKYDTDLNLINTSEVALKKGKKKTPYLGSVLFNDKLYLFSSIIERNGPNRELIHYYQTLNLESLQLNDDASEIFTLRHKGLVGPILSNFNWEISPDRSKILFTYDVLNGNSSRTSYRCNVYDNTLKRLYSKKLSIPDQPETPDFFLDNNGNLYTLNMDYIGKPKQKRRGEPKYNFLITKHSELGDKVEKIPVKVEGKDILDMTMSLKENGDLVCGGVYSSTKSFRADGVFFLTLDTKTNEIKSQSTNAFSPDFIFNSARVNASNSIVKKDDGPDMYLFRYIFQEMQHFDDGSTIFVAEQFSDFSVEDDNDNYYFGDLVIVKSSSNGDIEWINKIPKFQNCFDSDFYFGSYVAQRINGKLAFIFNDHMVNFGDPNINEIEDAYAARNNKSVLQIFDLDGNFERTDLSNIDKIGAVVLPSTLIKVNEKESFIFAKSRRNQNQKLGKIIFY